MNLLEKNNFASRRILEKNNFILIEEYNSVLSFVIDLRIDKITASKFVKELNS